MSTNAPAPPPSRPAPQFLRYAGAGAIGTALHYAVLISLVQLARVDAVVASTAGAVGGALVNYALNHRFTFASKKPHAHALPRFALVAAGGVLLNAVVMAGMLHVAGPHYLVAQVVATGAVLAMGFLANRAWTF
jgi:putative flippase GtrA